MAQKRSFGQEKGQEKYKKGNKNKNIRISLKQETMDISRLKILLIKKTNKKLRLNKRSMQPSGCYSCRKICLGHITIKCK